MEKDNWIFSVRKSSWSVPAGKGRKQKDIYDMQHAKKQKVDEEDDSGSGTQTKPTL